MSASLSATQQNDEKERKYKCLGFDEKKAEMEGDGKGKGREREGKGKG